MTDLYQALRFAECEHPVPGIRTPAHVRVFVSLELRCSSFSEDFRSPVCDLRVSSRGTVLVSGEPGSREDAGFLLSRGMEKGARCLHAPRL